MLKYSKEEEEMIGKIRKYIETHQMIEEKDIIVLGVSGGADSMCLLFVLEKLKEEMCFDIVVVHVNHMIRGCQADAEAEYVRQYCEERDIPFEMYEKDVKSYAAEHKLSEEEAGRMVRRMAFHEVAEKYGANKIALAHHMDDNAETFLLHLSRGSKLAGLGGMKPVNGAYIRPFLSVRRQEIEQYLEKEHVRFFVDETNTEDIYTRNRVRNHVIPYLCEHVNTQSVEHINSAMEYFRQVQEYLQKQMEMLWKDMVVIGEDRAVLKNELWQQDAVMRQMIIHRTLEAVSGKSKDWDACHVNDIEALADKQTGRQLDLPYSLCARRNYDGVEISVKKRQGNEEMTEVLLTLRPGETTSVCFGEWTVNCRVFKKTKEHCLVPKKTFTKWFDYDIINETVSIRTRRQGDYLVIDKLGNTQKLKKYFVNEKVPAEKRERIPVIAEGEQVLWVVGYRQNKAYQVSEKTITILEIELSGGEDYGRNN